MNDGADDSDLIRPAQPRDLGAGSLETGLRETGLHGAGPRDDGWRGDGSYAAESYGTPRPVGAHAAALRAVESYRTAPVELLDDDVMMLDAYSEDDNAVTQEVSGMLHEPRWLVQFTSLDRRLLETTDVISALLSGAIRRETLVWRGGMDDWVPVGRLDLLAQSAIPTLPPQRRSVAPGSAPRAVSTSALGTSVTSGSPSVHARPMELLLASVAIALSAATITTSFLSIAGVFDSHGEGAPSRVQALRAADVPAKERPVERAWTRDQNEPAPPDPERATAVAH